MTQVNGKSGKIPNVFKIALQAVHKTFHNLLLILNMFDMVRETCTFVIPHFGTHKSELFFSDHFVFWIANLGIHPSTDLPLIQKIYLAKEREIGSQITNWRFPLLYPVLVAMQLIINTRKQTSPNVWFVVWLFAPFSSHHGSDEMWRIQTIFHGLQILVCTAVNM